MRIPFLPPNDYRFPEQLCGLDEYDGLVAVSSDLAPERILSAYRLGIFPWFMEKGLFYWFATSPRAVLRPSEIHIGRSLAKTLRNKPYRVTVNKAFETVMTGCAGVPRPNQSGSWIKNDFITAYRKLHHMGHVHSFECWFPNGKGGEIIVGGLYGVQIGRVFYGESMFALQPDASKIAFAHAVKYLAECGIELIDCQQDTHHLARFGSELMDVGDFQTELRRLNALPLDCAVSQKVLADNFDKV